MRTESAETFPASRPGNPGGPTCQRRFRRTATSGRRTTSCSSPPVDSLAAPRCTAPWQARSPAYSCVPTPRSCSLRRGRSPAPPRRASRSSSTPERPPRRRTPCGTFIIPRASAPVRRVSKPARNYRSLGCTLAVRRNAPYHFSGLFFFQRAPTSALLVRLSAARQLIRRRDRGFRSRSSSSSAQAPARAFHASAASPTPPRPAPYEIAIRINTTMFVSGMPPFWLLNARPVLCRFAPRPPNQGTGTGGAIPASSYAMPPHPVLPTSLSTLASMHYSFSHELCYLFILCHSD
jgi:hypothetical protein